MHTGSKADTANGCCTFGSSAIEFVTSTASHPNALDASRFGFTATSTSALLIVWLCIEQLSIAFIVRTSRLTQSVILCQYTVADS